MNSPTPPTEEESDKELLQAYRSSSGHDPRSPHPKVRQAILEQAARVAKARSKSRRAPYVDWRWKAAASLAVVGLVGVLTLRNLHSPHATGATGATVNSVENAGNASTARTDEVQGEAAAATDRAEKASKEAAPLSEVVVTSKRRAGNQQQAKIAPPSAQAQGNLPLEASRVRQESRTLMAPAAPASPASPALASSPPPAAASGARAQIAPARSRAFTGELSSYWIDKVTAALHLRYPELFSSTAFSDAVRSDARHDIRVVLVLKADGAVYKSALEDTADAPNSNPSARLQNQLGVKPEELLVPAQTYYLDRMRDAPGDIVITLGVLRE